MSDYADVPPGVVAKLRSVCLGLPEAYQEPAWTGTRWRIRMKTFAHVLTLDGAWPASYPGGGAADGLVTVLTLRAPVPEIVALTSGGHPYYRPDWAANVLGMVLDADVDWAEVAELLTESYCIQAPKKLVELVARPAG